MTIFNNSTKNTKIDNKNQDVQIGIADDKDDIRKLKFKRRIMLRIFIPLCIISLAIVLICIFTLTNNNYSMSVEDETKFVHKIDKFLSKRRQKRQLDDCEFCENDFDVNLEESISRCKKNIEKQKDCCDLYRAIKKWKKEFDFEFDSLDIPCKNKDDDDDLIGNYIGSNEESPKLDNSSLTSFTTSTVKSNQIYEPKPLPIYPNDTGSSADYDKSEENEDIVVDVTVYEDITTVKSDYHLYKSSTSKEEISEHTYDKNTSDNILEEIENKKNISSTVSTYLSSDKDDFDFEEQTSKENGLLNDELNITIDAELNLPKLSTTEDDETARTTTIQDVLTSQKLDETEEETAKEVNTQPAFDFWENELKKANYGKNDHELKPELMNQLSNNKEGMEHHDDVDKYNHSIINDNLNDNNKIDDDKEVNELTTKLITLLVDESSGETDENFNSKEESTDSTTTTKTTEKYIFLPTSESVTTLKEEINTEDLSETEDEFDKQSMSKIKKNSYEEEVIDDSKEDENAKFRKNEQEVEENIGKSLSSDSSQETSEIFNTSILPPITSTILYFTDLNSTTTEVLIIPNTTEIINSTDFDYHDKIPDNFEPVFETTSTIFENVTDFANESSENNVEPRLGENPVNDVRIVNQNPIAQRFQNTGSKFDNIFQLPPVETSKASQQLTVNTNMLPMCFYGFPNQNGAAFRQPTYESQVNPFSLAHTTYTAFGYPQMYPNNVGQQPMFNMYNNMLSQQKFSGNFVNQPPYMTNPYFCTYIPSSSLQFPPVSGLPEFRNIENKNFQLPEDVDDKTIPENLLPIFTNKSRSSLNCLPEERSCFDDSQCIKNSNWCDGIVHCKDQSDEIGCPCKTRVDKNRLCDGYFDCPNGEDELGCFGCSKTEFSCDDWSERQKRATCVPLGERCDGIPQCKTGKDEMDCSLLTNTVNVHQTYAVSKSIGYLHRNYKGSWFPVCSNTDSWVLEACLAEVGPQATFPLVHLMPVPPTYSGQFLTALGNKKVEFLKSCIGNEAIYVVCPPIPCGTRLIPPPNHFRKQEVDTSAEEEFLPFVSRLKRFTDELEDHKNHENINNILLTNDFDDKNKKDLDQDKKTQLMINKNMHTLVYDHWKEKGRLKRGDNRVVGGKPSQPTSWPWVVAIYRDGIFHCGGVLMSELWVITAAHCADMYWQHYYEVQAGMLRRFSFSPMEQNRVVSNIISHQMYDRSDMKNDLCLLKMAKPFQFNRWVRPVCLPSESSAGPNWLWGPQPGTICTAVGWGATVEHGPDPDHMREVEVPILSQCKHREDQEGQEICAGYLEGGRDACQGDSGGPLLCRNPIAPSQWYVAGIVSHGEGCARPNEPGAYTRVSLYLNWISRSILDENLPKRIPIQKCPGTLCLGTHRCISKKRRCDKTVDCLVGDDEMDCPNTNFPSLIKHAFENMILFSSNNMTTTEDMITETTTIFSTTAVETETTIVIKDDAGTSIPTTASEIPSTSIIPSTTVDRISESTSSTTTTMSTHITEQVSDVTVTTSIRTTVATTPSPETNVSRGALNTDDKKTSDMDHKTETTLPTEIKPVTEPNAGADDFTKNNTEQTPTYFECKKMLQLIPMSRRCNKVLDCEDGTDEVRCNCKEYLMTSYPSAICDGIIDCNDGTDEKNCLNCPENHFHCHLSQQCIPKNFQCNHISNCVFNEDEWDCFALTNTSFIKYDKDDRPELRGNGIMSFSFSGKWFPLCNKNWFNFAPDAAGDMCAYLGFSGYQKYFETEVQQDNLNVINDDSTSIERRLRSNESCKALYVKCSNSLSDIGDMNKIYTAHQSGANTFKEVLTSPWNAAIFTDGAYICTGTLIDKDWVITSRLCLHHINLRTNYTTIILGTGKGHFNVIGPHEQIRIISEIVPIVLTDIVLLRLKESANFTRYVRPLYIRNINNDIISDKETCIVTGKEDDSILQTLVLKPVLSKCSIGKRCFKRITPLTDCENVAKKSKWGGTIVCLSESGWYPSAVFYDLRGICGFRQTTEYTSIRNLKMRIISAMNKQDFPVTLPICNGHRCPLGRCIESRRICDGILDCRDGSDETQDACDQKAQHCTATSTCECAPGELRCENGKCISKSAFCDRVNDCGDWSDEPARCNCSSYLALVAPQRICDGIANCHDKTDENPRVCGCHPDKFKCGNSGYCVPNDFVCDGDFDCPGKEDEKLCLALKAPTGGRDGVGEVMLRSYGIWHPYCLQDKQPTIPELEEICSDLQYPSGHAAIVNKTFSKPAQDIDIENYSLVRLNQYVLMLLKGDQPMAKLVENENCRRLYIECTVP